MLMEYNIYCDESCHLPNDTSSTMVLGGIWCLKEKKKEIFKRLKEIKIKHSPTVRAAKFSNFIFK